MAAVLNYGNEHHDQRSMHPFFKTTLIRPQTPDPEPRGSQATPGHTLDGASDDPKDADTFIDIQEHGQPIGKIEARGISDQLGASAALEDERSATTPLLRETEIDPNYERRKRRKTSPRNSPVANGGNNGFVHSPAIADPQSWQAQLEEAAKEAGSGSPETDMAASNPSPDSPLVQPSPASSKRSVRRMKLQQGTNANSLPDNLGESHLANVPENHLVNERLPPLPNSNPPKSTSSKKMLKLSKSGKLLSSPKQPVPASKPTSRTALSVTLKKGKLSSSLRVTMKYGGDDASRSRIGNKVTNILQSSALAKPSDLAETQASLQITHPFFLGKLRPKIIGSISATPSDLSTRAQDSERDGSVSPRPKKATDWKDLIFTTKKYSTIKNSDALEPCWPPNELQRLGRDSTYTSPAPLPTYGLQKSKLKEYNVSVGTAEDVLNSFTTQLSQHAASAKPGIVLPEKRVTSARRMLRSLGKSSINSTSGAPWQQPPLHDAVTALRASLNDHLSPFDVGRLDCGQDWATKYAPTKAAHVLQPGGKILRDWLSNLGVDNVKARADAAKSSHNRDAQGRKKRRRKKADHLDDFIASSDDDSHNAGGAVKNAIMLSGPSGCGKTASVYAVANELNFEVFEIHPGMRRSARDIFDKVGDMTQNHLVQQATKLDTELGTTSVNASSRGEHVGSKIPVHGTLGKLFGTKSRAEGKQKAAKDVSSQESEPTAKASKAQRESLVLFEEVDILFEEDKSFWNGVLTLIQQSKRPVILTCNEIRGVPVEDLELHATLRFEPPPLEMVVEYLLLIAAKEGHILERDATAALYESKGQDLRATLTELQFWCQMTLGSQQGGLDWMLDRRLPASDVDATGDKLRVFSKDTFTKGLDIYPHGKPCASSREHEEGLEQARDDLRVPLLHWHEDGVRSPLLTGLTKLHSSEERLCSLRHMESLADSRSVLDITHDCHAAKMSVAITKAFFPGVSPPGSEEHIQAYLETRRTHNLAHKELVAAFEPLTAEKHRVFPLAIGRLAPSFDGPTSTIAADIAPYVRSIISFDQRLEQQRDQLAGGSQGKKTRTTRASRAALEGGDKVSTRRERWLPLETDFKKVLTTGGRWPQWHSELEFLSSQSAAPSPESDSSSQVEDVAASAP